MGSDKQSRREFGGETVSRRIGEALVRADQRIEDFGLEGYQLMSLTIQTPWKRGSEFLVVGRIETGGTKCVAFHSADTLYEALRGFCERFTDKRLELKEDQYG